MMFAPLDSAGYSAGLEGQIDRRAPPGRHLVAMVPSLVTARRAAALNNDQLALMSPFPLQIRVRGDDLTG